MIRKLLIANRGEIAVRIIRTCRAMGIATVAVYAEPDRDSLAVSMADEAVALGGTTPAESYLVIEKILMAARQSGADAIHPGFGFLAENAAFAYQVKTHGLTFIGPSPASIEAMGDKRFSKLLLTDVPFVPGYIADAQDEDSFIRAAADIGYPIMVKAAAGGGGKGMRLVHTADELPAALASARREAAQAFGNDALMLERAVLSPRHIEVQVFGDQLGSIISLGERECSIQRRHQKIVEEAPSSALTPELRQQICATAVRVAQQIGYYSAGTVEFLLDSDGRYYFMEMNTRLQVEHPVTEMIYGVDLVRWQLQVADGASLEELTGGKPPEAHGHAVEVRVYAEDPAHQFLPVTGTVAYFQPALAARTDSGIQSGDVISPYYDPMLAKVIAWAETRGEAIRGLDYALAHTKLLGMTHNIAYLRRVLMSADFLAGDISTDFVPNHADLLVNPTDIVPAVLIAAALARSSAGAWRNFVNRPVRHVFRAWENQYVVLLEAQTDGTITVTVDGLTFFASQFTAVAPEVIFSVNGLRQTAVVVAADERIWVHLGGNDYSLHWVNPLPETVAEEDQTGSLRAPMPGKVVQVAVAAGDTVEKGALLMIVEAMKMEHRIEAPYDGQVEQVHYQAGDLVQADQVLLALNPA